MPLEVLTTPSFARTAKKLHVKDKKTVDQAVTAIANDATLGEEKKGDLAGLFVHKFKLNPQETLLAYGLNPNRKSPTQVVLLAVGPHKNFYAQLKR